MAGVFESAPSLLLQKRAGAVEADWAAVDSFTSPRCSQPHFSQNPTRSLTRHGRSPACSPDRPRWECPFGGEPSGRLLRHLGMLRQSPNTPAPGFLNESVGDFQGLNPTFGQGNLRFQPIGVLFLAQCTDSLSKLVQNRTDLSLRLKQLFFRVIRLHSASSTLHLRTNR